jgi:hypothetical protein
MQDCDASSHLLCGAAMGFNSKLTLGNVAFCLSPFELALLPASLLVSLFFFFFYYYFQLFAGLLSLSLLSMLNSSTSRLTIQGWMPSPNGRGTADILESCLLTIGLCIWTSVYPNLPSNTDRKRHCFLHKLKLACIGMLGPEFVFIIALGQLSSALRSRQAFRQLQSRKDFKDEKLPAWTLRHSFFADMGGFVLRSSDQPDFPVDSQQLLWLVEKGYVEYPTVTEKEIDDKNKVDGLSRCVSFRPEYNYSCLQMPCHSGLSRSSRLSGSPSTLSFVQLKVSM